jgi:outer membrane protein OmpA-like peptidoglycan-associated protein
MIPKRTHTKASRRLHAALFGLGLLFASACSSKPVEGPDKLFSGTGVGAIEGAGAGAITGAQLSAGAGPGVAVGAGFGAVVGMIQGAMSDGAEAQEMKLAAELKREKKRTFAQEVLAEHYKRRKAIHPSRDIFPADVFFSGDSVKMCSSGVSVVEEIARMNEFRLPYSRLVIASYAKATSPSTYADHLTEERAKEFVNQLVRAGIEPRRLETRVVVTDAPVLIDPFDNPTRYNQAIEIIAIDR